MKKQANTNNTNTEQVVDDDEIDSIFNFHLEEKCYENMWIDAEAKVAYKRQKPPEQIPWDLF